MQSSKDQERLAGIRATNIAIEQLKSRIDLAIQYIDCGNLTAAANSHNGILAKWATVAGKRDDSILLSFGRLIEAWKSREDSAEVKVYEKTLHHYDKILGLDNQETKKMATALVKLYLNQGKLQEAGSMMQQRGITDVDAGLRDEAEQAKVEGM
jgi:hypothetical protein